MRALVIFLALCALASAYPKFEKKSNKATYYNSDTQFDIVHDYINPDVDKVQSGKQGRRQFTTEPNEDGSGDYNNDDNEDSDDSYKVPDDENPSVQPTRRNLEPSGKDSYVVDEEEYSDGEDDDTTKGEPIALPLLSNDAFQNQPKHTNYPRRQQESDKKSNKATYDNSGTQFDLVDDYIDPDVDKVQSGKQDDESNYETEKQTERPLDIEPSTEDSYYEDL